MSGSYLPFGGEMLGWDDALNRMVEDQIGDDGEEDDDAGR